MRFSVAMFTATSTAEVTSFASEPVAMLLWGTTLLAFSAMLRRANSRAAEPVYTPSTRSESQVMDGVPSFAARS